MIFNFQDEVAKRRDPAWRTRPAPSDHLGKAAPPFERLLPKVEAGSGWYHGAALEEAGPHRSHRD